MAKANSADRRFAGGRYRPDAYWDFALQLDTDDPDSFWNLLDEFSEGAVMTGLSVKPTLALRCCVDEICRRSGRRPYSELFTSWDFFVMA
jgi:hypothetical protein